jgi:hypothetical protein
MATKKATTTSDLAGDDLTASAQDPSPSQEDTLSAIEELTDPGVVAKVEQPKTVKVKSPLGAVTEVPEGIVDSLLDSGYSKSK